MSHNHAGHVPNASPFQQEQLPELANELARDHGPACSYHPERSYEPESSHNLEEAHDQTHWEDLESYTGSSDYEHHTREHHTHEQLHNSVSERTQCWTDTLGTSQSVVTQHSVNTYEEEAVELSPRDYDEEDVEWWHGIVSAPRDNHWDRVQVFVFASFMVLVCFFGGVTVWILIR